MPVFFKIPQEFHDNVVENIDWTSSEMNDILGNRKK